MMISGNDGIRPVPFRFRGQREDDKAADDATKGRDEEQQERVQGSRCLGKERRLSFRRAGMVACGNAERIIGNHLTGNIEDNGTKTRDDTHNQRQSQNTGLAAHTLLA